MTPSNSNPHEPDYGFFLLAILLSILGLAMITSASAVFSFDRFGDNYYFLKHQFFYGVIPGIILLLVASKIKYTIWQKLALPFLFLTIILLVAVFIPGIGFGYGGARRWIHIGSFSLQPAEICKLTFIIYLAALLTKKGKSIKDFSLSFIPFVILIGVIGFLIMREPDMGTAVVIGISSFIMYFVAGVPLWQLFLLGVTGGFVGWLLIKIAPYRMARLTVFLHPEIDPQGIGYQINQALLAIGSGGIFGLGFGHSRQKYLYLPEPAGDSIFAILGEELGLIGCLMLIILFLVFAYKGLKISQNAPDTFSKLLTVGITSWITFQVFINISAMIGLIPLTGIPLPFIS